MFRKEDFHSAPPTTEATKEQYTPEQFLDILYSETFLWLKNSRGGRIVAQVESQEIDRWDEHDGRHPGNSVWLPFNLVKGILMKTPQHDFALVLGYKIQSRHSHKETLTLEFGFQPIENKKLGDKPAIISTLKALATRNRNGSYGRGEFYEDSQGSVRVSCWADGFKFGGQEINKWEKDELLSKDGVSASLEIVQRTVINAFV